MSLDIKDHFLQSILEDLEYLRTHNKYSLVDIREKYNITPLIAPNRYVYCKIKRGMYVLKQAARLARDQLIAHIKPFGYYPSIHDPNIWAHD